MSNKSPPPFTTASDMKPFCSTDEIRPYLHNPFSRGDYSYATNGHIIVRVRKVAEISENDQAPDAGMLFLREFSSSRLRPMNVEVLPAKSKGKKVFGKHRQGNF
jgi:hypothetical protein